MPFWSTLGSIASTIIPGLSNLGQGIVNANVARENTDKTIAANKELAAYQYSKDVEMWNRGNVYNAPQAQMDRLRAAGLNPNMVYGSGSVAGQAAGQLPKYNAPTVSYNYQPPVDLPSMISQFQDFRIRNAQVRNMETQGEILGQKEVMGRSDVDLYPSTAYLKNALLRAKEGREGWSNFDYDSDSRTAYTNAQREFALGKNRKQALEMNRLVSATKNLDLQNDYFAAKAITGLFGGIVGGVGKLGAMFKSKAPIPNKWTPAVKPATRWNSPTSWKNAGF